VMHELKDWLNSINQTKKNIIDENPDSERTYNPYIINRCMSGHIDTILCANEMNLNSHLDKKLQYDFYINIIRPKKRYSPWLKKEKFDDLSLVKEYYGYSDEKAKNALKLLSKEQIDYIKLKLNRGGKK
jgi:hypothetical protein